MAYDTSSGKFISPKPKRIAAPVLRWYRKNARTLPWRISPGDRATEVKADAYRVWLSEIMLQQTTVATVTPRYDRFLARWPNVTDMAAAPLEDILSEWAGLGYYARARNLHKCARTIVDNHGGFFPDTEDQLRALPGVGAYTAAAVAAIAFDKHAIVLDGNIERIIARLFAEETALPRAKPLLREHAQKIWPSKNSGDFAQAMMDIGASVCKPKSPNCPTCPIHAACDAFALGSAERFPVKPPKKQKPTRYGDAYALFNKRGEVLLEKRPENGLLGGMMGLPTTAWTDEIDSRQHLQPPFNAQWKNLGEIAHTFTHFHLRLYVHAAPAPKGFRRSADQKWERPNEARVPTVMKKAIDLIGDPDRIKENDVGLLKTRNVV